MANTTDGHVDVPNTGSAPIDVADKTRADGSLVQTQRVIITDAVDPALHLTLQPDGSLPTAETGQDLHELLMEQTKLLNAILHVLMAATGILVDPDNLD